MNTLEIIAASGIRGVNDTTTQEKPHMTSFDNIKELSEEDRQNKMYADYKNYLIKNKLYDKDLEGIIGVNKQFGVDNPKEVQDYIKNKEEAKKAFIESVYTSDVSSDKGVDLSPILFGGPAFTVGEAAFETGYQAIMTAIPEDKKSEYPVLSSILGVAGTVAAAFTGKKAIGAASETFTRDLYKNYDSAMSELDALVKKNELDPKVLEDMGLTPEKIKGAATQDAKQNPYSNIDTTKPLDLTNLTTLKTVSKVDTEAAKIIEDVAPIFKAEEDIITTPLQPKTATNTVTVPTTIANKVDDVPTVPKVMTKQDELVSDIRTFNITKFENTLPDSRKVTRVKLQKVEQTVSKYGFDKSISKFLKDGDVDAAVLRAEEIKANKSTEGIQRPGTADYKPLSNDYVYAHAAPEIAAGLLGVGIEYYSQADTGELDLGRLAAAFLIGAGGVAGGKYLWNKAKRTTPSGIEIVEEAAPAARLENLKETRLDEINSLIASVKNDITTAASQRAEKLNNTLNTLEGVKKVIENTKDVRKLTEAITPEALRQAMKKAGETIVKVEKPTAAQVKGMATNVAEGTAPKVTALNLGNIHNAEELENVFNVVEDSYKEAFTKTKVSFKETEKLADDLGFNVKDLNGLYKNTEELHGRLLAARQFRDTLATDILKVSKELDEADKLGKPIDEIAIELQSKFAQFTAVHAMVSKSTTEIARALSSNRITSRAKKDISFVNNQDILNALGSGSLSGLKQAAKKLSHKVSLDSHDHMFVKSMLQPNAMNMVEELYLNALLSNPKTHLMNAASNLFTGLHSIVNKYAEVGTTVFSKDRVTFKEANAYLGGYIGSIREALKMAKMSGQKGEPILDWIQKEDGMQYQAISGDTLPGLGMFGKTLGATVNSPFKALMMSDEFFKVLAYRAEFNASAVRHAMDDASLGKIRESDIGRRIEELKSNETTKLVEDAMSGVLEGNLLAMHRQSLANARFLTHTNPLGEFGQGIQKIHSIPGGKLLIPFIRTPINILKYTGKHTPGINFLSEGERANFASGGRARGKVLARMATGSALYTLGWSLAADGTITGKMSADLGEVESLKAAGIQPDSIKIGDSYIPYQGMDTPFAMFKIMADVHSALERADFRDTELMDEVMEVGAALTLAFGQMAENSTWLSSVGEIITLLQEPKNPDIPAGEKFETYIANKIAGFIPAALYGITKEQDQYMREARTIVDKLMQKIPGLSNDMPIQYDMYGQPKKHSTGLYPKAQEISLDPVKAELARIKYDAGYIGKRINGIEVSPEIRSYITKTKGEYFYSYASQLVNSDSWQELQDGTPQIPGSKETSLKKLESLAQTMAIEEAKTKFPDFGKELEDRRMEIINTRYLGQ